jgi:large subunit ribosomal protein L9
MLKREVLQQKAASLKQRIEELTLAIGARAGEEGKLFGSVTNIDIERALREHGFEIDRRRIVLGEPIKQLGHFAVTVKLESEVEAHLTVNVTAAGE